MVGKSGGRAVLDHRDPLRFLRPEHPQAAVTMERVLDAALPARWLRGQIAVVGLARSGRSAAQLLARAGADVYASDVSATPAVDATARALRDEGVSTDVGRHDLERIARASLIVASPGVPPDAPPFVAAREAGVDIVSEVEIGLRFLPRLSYVAITGSNGKTTTTALTGHLLTALGRRASTAGNIGTPLCELAVSRTPPAWVALEISSFQLHDTPSIDPTVGVLTNLSANHLDRYAGVDEYYGDKMLMFRNAKPTSSWITNADDADSERLTADLGGLHCRFSVQETAEAYLDRSNEMLMVLGHPLMPRSELPLLGDHNVANALAASLAVMLADREHRTPHALERIARRDARVPRAGASHRDGGGARWGFVDQ